MSPVFKVLEMPVIYLGNSAVSNLILFLFVHCTKRGILSHQGKCFQRRNTCIVRYQFIPVKASGVTGPGWEEGDYHLKKKVIITLKPTSLLNYSPKIIKPTPAKIFFLLTF